MQVYIFIEASVWAEYRTFLKNKAVSGFQSAHVDNLRVYGFLEELQALPHNNPISPFETAADITRTLKEQWAGLFQRFLRDQTRAKEVSLIKDMQASTKTLNELITFLTEEKRNSSEAVRHILLMNHPAFSALKAAIRCPTPVFFRNREEFEAWMKCYGWAALSEGEWDEFAYEEWTKKGARAAGTFSLIKISTDLFEDRKLRMYTADEWQADMIRREERAQGLPPSREITDDDVPF